MSIQLNFDDAEKAKLQAEIKSIYEEFDIICKSASREIDRTLFSAIVNKSYSTVSDILNSNEKGGSYPVIYLIATAILIPDRFRETILEFLAYISNSQPPEKKKALMPEEELKILKQRIRDHKLESILLKE